MAFANSASQTVPFGVDSVARLNLAGSSLIADAVTVEMVGALREAGVNPLLIKGPTVAKWLYDTRAERPYGDTDLLIGPRDAVAARDLLSGLGFAEAPVSDLHDRVSPGVEWLRASDGTVVDLHHTLHGLDAPPGVVWKILNEKTDTIWLQDTPVETLSEAGRTLLVSLHARHHGPQEHVLRDLERAVDVLPYEVWEQASDLAARLGASEVFSEGLRLIPAGAALADRLGVAGGSWRTSLLAQNAPMADLGYALYLNEMRAMTAPEKIRFLARRFVPTPRELRWWKEAERFEGSLPAAYVVRLWRMAGRTLRAIGILSRARRSGRGSTRSHGRAA